MSVIFGIKEENRIIIAGDKRGTNIGVQGVQTR